MFISCGKNELTNQESSMLHLTKMEVLKDGFQEEKKHNKIVST